MFTYKKPSRNFIPKSSYCDYYDSFQTQNNTATYLFDMNLQAARYINKSLNNENTRLQKPSCNFIPKSSYCDYYDSFQTQNNKATYLFDMDLQAARYINKSLNKENTRLQNENNNLRKENTTLQNVTEQQNLLIKDLKNKNTAMQEQINNLMKKINNAQQKKEDNKESLNSISFILESNIKKDYIESQFSSNICDKLINSDKNNTSDNKSRILPNIEIINTSKNENDTNSILNNQSEVLPNIDNTDSNIENITKKKENIKKYTNTNENTIIGLPISKQHKRKKNKNKNKHKNGAVANNEITTSSSNVNSNLIINTTIVNNNINEINTSTSSTINKDYNESIIINPDSKKESTQNILVSQNSKKDNTISLVHNEKFPHDIHKCKYNVLNNNSLLVDKKAKNNNTFLIKDENDNNITNDNIIIDNNNLEQKYNNSERNNIETDCNSNINCNAITNNNVINNNKDILETNNIITSTNANITNKSSNTKRNTNKNKVTTNKKKKKEKGSKQTTNTQNDGDDLLDKAYNTAVEEQRQEFQYHFNEINKISSTLEESLSACKLQISKITFEEDYKNWEDKYNTLINKNTKVYNSLVENNKFTTQADKLKTLSAIMITKVNLYNASLLKLITSSDFSVYQAIQNKLVFIQVSLPNNYSNIVKDIKSNNELYKEVNKLLFEEYYLCKMFGNDNEWKNNISKLYVNVKPHLSIDSRICFKISDIVEACFINDCKNIKWGDIISNNNKEILIQKLSQYIFMQIYCYKVIYKFVNEKSDNNTQHLQTVEHNNNDNSEQTNNNIIYNNNDIEQILINTVLQIINTIKTSKITFYDLYKIIIPIVTKAQQKLCNFDNVLLSNHLKIFNAINEMLNDENSIINSDNNILHYVTEALVPFNKGILNNTIELPNENESIENLINWFYKNTSDEDNHIIEDIIQQCLLIFKK